MYNYESLILPALHIDYYKTKVEPILPAEKIAEEHKNLDVVNEILESFRRWTNDNLFAESNNSTSLHQSFDIQVIYIFLINSGGQEWKNCSFLSLTTSTNGKKSIEFKFHSSCVQLSSSYLVWWPNYPLLMYAYAHAGSPLVLLPLAGYSNAVWSPEN